MNRAMADFGLRVSALRRRAHVVLAALGLSLVLSGCSGALLLNLTEESQRNITVLLINNTPFRAIFTIGAFDDLDRLPPGQITFQQLRIEGGTTRAPLTFSCFRDVAIGSQKMLDRIVDTDNNTAANFDDDAFVLGVSFSSAPLGSPGEGQPDSGTAPPRVVRLGNDYTCDDQLIFTFEQNTDGSFRIDYEVLRSTEDDS